MNERSLPSKHPLILDYINGRDRQKPFPFKQVSFIAQEIIKIHDDPYFLLLLFLFLVR